MQTVLGGRVRVVQAAAVGRVSNYSGLQRRHSSALSGRDSCRVNGCSWLGGLDRRLEMRGFPFRGEISCKRSSSHQLILDRALLGGLFEKLFRQVRMVFWIDGTNEFLCP
jgi:hypothetical protein